ncbi:MULTISPECIES: type III secretion system export apparatus subunit SctU [Vibrio]|uniref:type III secretion system export apparatus subunit SctU n=1 Tax=Vibrio TaxID=662 RepID=UPI0001B953E8|nr:MULTISPECIES: type III secretion system export apparatus subunit SctU [Vibrio]EEX34249.1 type III secretion protein HrpY [Vibrio coralliilyticus ATCC BAA-450]MDE3898659.1 type III secretion system export apparatus subunit SctU [Vibrio sp. CC007]
MAEKTEKPTQKKIQDSRKRGQVAQTPDIPKLLACVLTFEVLVACSEWLMAELKTLVYMPITLFNQPFEHGFLSVLEVAKHVLFLFILIVIPVSFFAALIGRWGQFGFLFAPEALKLDFNKLNPFSQLKQLFSGQKLTEVLNNIFKSILIFVVFYILLNDLAHAVFKLPNLPLDRMWLAAIDLFIYVARVCLLLLLAPAILDFALKKFFHLKQLKMDKQEVKQEFKDSEGDPFVKSQRRQLGMELVEGSPQTTNASMDEMDMLVVNPTHFAVGLHYNPGVTPLPVVGAKGKDREALELIQQADHSGVPVIRYVWLARTLYQQELGSYINRDTLDAVASLYTLLNDMDSSTEDR